MKYSDFANIFLKKLAKVLPKRAGINKHTINLIDGKLAHYGPIYSLDPIGLKILRTYIQANLANNFIWLSKSYAATLIFFV